jgi:APA family basic amino acid/polyamine antiporter
VRRRLRTLPFRIDLGGGALSPRSPALLRQIGLGSAIALVVSNMIGTGIFTTTGFLAGDLGTVPLVLLIWVVGAVCALAGAFCYSELGINFPSSGGEYVYLTEAYGPTWGFMTGWASFFAGFSAPIALAALACSDYAGYFFPALKQANALHLFGSGEWEFKIGGAQIFASSLVIVFTALNCFGVRRTANVQNVLTSLKVLVIVAFIVLGFAFGHGSADHFSQPALRTSTTPLFSQFAISLFFIYLSYSGWNAATYVAEELRQPARTLPMALAIGTILVAVLFCGLNLLFIYASPLEQMKGVLAVGSLAASHLFGPAVAGIFSAAMAVSLLATVNAMVTIGPRVYFAMAKNGAFFSAAARVDPRWHTPVAAIVAQGICAVVMTMTPFVNLMFYIGCTLNFFAVMSVASLFIFRRRSGWSKLPVVNFAFPLMPSLFIIVGIWMTILGVRFRPGISAIAALTIAAGAVAYHLRMRGRPRPVGA